MAGERNLFPRFWREKSSQASSFQSSLGTGHGKEQKTGETPNVLRPGVRTMTLNGGKRGKERTFANYDRKNWEDNKLHMDPVRQSSVGRSDQTIIEGEKGWTGGTSPSHFA